MNFLGIDPGLEGAAALLLEGVFDRVDDTPIILPKGGKGKRIYSEVGMASIVRAARDRCAGSLLVVIEQVGARPGQGVSSMFNFGMGYGIWLGIFGALEVAHVRVAPVTWKKRLLADTAKTDAAVASVAGRLYPQAAPLMMTPRGRALTGRADALLLAHYGRVSGL